MPEHFLPVASSSILPDRRINFFFLCVGVVRVVREYWVLD
jgi:hypothetical protein